MDVLIKNFELPKERIMLEIFPNGRVLEINPHNNARIPTEAEAIELQEHGDLCDKDELMNEVDSTYMWEQAVRKVRLAPVIVEASDGIDN